MPRGDPPGTPARCRSCGEKVVWTVTEHRKKMPVDLTPRQDGKFYLFRKPDRIEAVHTGGQDPRILNSLIRGQAVYTSHFATCPAAGEHRRGRQ
jgi:hypothetical protein